MKWLESPTLKDRLDAHKGIGPGFDLLRILLALAIFYGHAFWIAGSGSLPDQVSAAVWGGWRRPAHVALVPMFFALSGFLVAGSALRLKNTAKFLAFRALRIFPALSVEVMLSAIILGPVFTTVALGEYFGDEKFLRYLGNILGFVSFELPGVFATNPIPHIVNINLWTLPAEFYCYLITAALMASGLLYRRRAFTLIFIVVSAVLVSTSLATGFGVSRSAYPAAVVVYYFFCGMLVYHWRDIIPANILSLVIASLISYALLLYSAMVFIAPLFLTLATALFGSLSIYTFIPRLKILAKTDYSYGIYLYGCPIAQAVVASHPEFRGNGWGILLVSGILTLLFASASWHFVEKPTLMLKRHLSSKRLPIRTARVETSLR